MATPPRGISERAMDSGNIVGINWSPDAMGVARRIQTVWNFIENELRPSYLTLWRKVSGMLNSPPQMGNPFFDGTTWHSVRLGVLAPDLLDSNETLTVAMGDVHIQRKDSLTAPRTKTLSTSGASNGNVKVLYNMSAFAVTFGSAITPAGYYSKLRYDGAAWVDPEVLRIVADPEF